MSTTVTLADTRDGTVYVQDTPARSPRADVDPYVLLHGWACRSTDWDPLLEGLSQHARVVALDLPGHGRSSPSSDGYSLPVVARTVSTVLDQLGVRRATLVGHSAGAEVALAISLAEPARVKRLVSVDPAYGFVDADRARLHGIADRLDQEDPASVAAEYFAFIEGPDTPRELVDAHVASARTADPDAMRGVFRQFAFGPGNVHFRPDLDAAMGRSRAPLLAVYRNALRAEAGRAVAVQPKDEVVVYDGSGHWLHQEQPARFLSTLLAWENRTPTTAHARSSG